MKTKGKWITCTFNTLVCDETRAYFQPLNADSGLQWIIINACCPQAIFFKSGEFVSKFVFIIGSYCLMFTTCLALNGIASYYRKCVLQQQKSHTQGLTSSEKCRCILRKNDHACQKGCLILTCYTCMCTFKTLLSFSVYIEIPKGGLT